MLILFQMIQDIEVHVLLKKPRDMLKLNVFIC